MISGRQALARIEQAIAGARQEEARVNAALRAKADEAARLRLERMNAFRELARLKLDTMTRDGVVGQIEAAEREAMRILASRRLALQSRAERRERAERAVQERETQRHAIAAELEAALKAVEQKRAAVEADARVSSEWVGQRTRLDQAAEVAREAEKKAVLAEADREQKRKPYEADPLFMYLWTKKFGTAEDRSGALTRFFDRKVARLIGYDKARANYALLNEIPHRLREHAARMMAEIEAERARLKALERTALVQAGIEPLEAKATAARASLDGVERELAAARAELAALDREPDASALQGDGPYREAIEVLAKADAAQDLRALYRKAAATASPQDDLTVRRIEGIEAAIGRAEQELGALSRQLGGIVQRRSALEREWEEFRQRGYDAPYGTFGNEAVLGSVLGGVLGGVLQGTVLRDVLRDGFHRQPGPWDSDFGGGFSPFPQDGGGWGDGGGSDRGFGGDGGGDGFTTGGSV